MLARVLDIHAPRDFASCTCAMCIMHLASCLWLVSRHVAGDGSWPVADGWLVKGMAGESKAFGFDSRTTFLFFHSTRNALDSVPRVHLLFTLHAIGSSWPAAVPTPPKFPIQAAHGLTR